METAFTALTTAPLVPLLERLYEEADAESPATSPAVTELIRTIAKELHKLVQAAAFAIESNGRRIQLRRRV
jgi:hypothetical protein